MTHVLVLNQYTHTGSFCYRHHKSLYMHCLKFWFMQGVFNGGLVFLKILQHLSAECKQDLQLYSKVAATKYSSSETITRSRSPRLNGKLQWTCGGWLVVGQRYWWASVAFICKSVMIKKVDNLDQGVQEVYHWAIVRCELDVWMETVCMQGVPLHHDTKLLNFPAIIILKPEPLKCIHLILRPLVTRSFSYKLLSLTWWSLIGKTLFPTFILFFFFVCVCVVFVNSVLSIQVNLIYNGSCLTTTNLKKFLVEANT